MSFQAQRATVSKELLTRLDAVADGHSPRSDIERIKFSAQRLKNADRKDYLMVLGIAHALEDDIEGFWNCFRPALDEFGYDQLLVINGYLALSESGHREEAVELLRRGVTSFRDPEALEKALAVFSCDGYLSDSKSIAALLDRMKGTSMLEEMECNERVLLEKGLSEEDIQNAANCLRENLRALGYRRFRINFSYDNCADWGSGLTHSVCLPESAGRLFEIENCINAKMIEANLSAVNEGAYIWYFKADAGAPRACNVG